MIFHPIQKHISSLVPTVIINGIQKEKVYNFNFLGICLDSDLKWDGQIKLLATKLENIFGNLPNVTFLYDVVVSRLLNINAITASLCTYFYYKNFVWYFIVTWSCTCGQYHGWLGFFLSSVRSRAAFFYNISVCLEFILSIGKFVVETNGSHYECIRLE